MGYQLVEDVPMDDKKFAAIREAAKARIAARSNVVIEAEAEIDSLGEMNVYETPEELVAKLTQKAS